MLQRTGRALAYLIVGLPAGVAGFVWSLAATLVVALTSITHLGGPAFLGASWVTRRFADAERRRARWVLGTPIPSPYVPTGGRTVGERVRAVVVQPATWRDLVWLVLLFPIGPAAAVAGIVTAVVELGILTAVLWAWAVPNPHAPEPMRFLMTTVPGRLVLTVLGVLLLPVAGWLIRTLGGWQGRAARALLAPGMHRHLVDETARLAETRRRVVDVQAAELRRIERDLHDGAQARIVAAGMTLALAARKLRRVEPNRHGPTNQQEPANRQEPTNQQEQPDTAADIDLARRQLDEALAEMRRLVRGIHPPILTDRGLHAAVAALAGDSPLTVTVQGDPEDRYPAAVESAAYFVVAEGLANAAKHAGAGRCTVSLGRSSGRSTGTVQVTVTDDGDGGADPAGSGLDGLRRRVEALDGTLTVTSPAGGPTVLHAEFPCAS
ncbi:putative two-component system sensor kinase [Actinoplanes missouriensis 431]|uniref:histidine kinase n=1 Tax=Actinoplanes missouriensis (strain ATCC 14538 / DSM 43046 / CBS 188.64 / JCM 3121 / NBRC 102363 / NCIMB 12654 / NRRL B-3342 / UNCC 431) TaxID=512565 RepID=I0H545_ACTM4|nr:sensor histidine kinase [Actinoplanes missouriensis]BAL88132.1 putative two-component system sensor kinase [Actinoplanes missouriensis 431]